MLASCGVIAWGGSGIVWCNSLGVGVASCGVIAWGGSGIMWCNSLGVGVASCRAMSGVRLVGILVMLVINVSLMWLLVIRGPCFFSTTEMNVYK